MTRLPVVLGALALAAAPAGGAAAQGIPLSQHGTVTQRVGVTDIGISYNRPVARGRRLFGGIVRWRHVWHPGADSATTIQFSRDVLVQGHPLAAGRYTLPDSLQWTVIFSRAVNVFHVPYPGASFDVLRVSVTPEQGSDMEVLAYYFPVVGSDSAVLRLHWGTIMVPLHIRTTP